MLKRFPGRMLEAGVLLLLPVKCKKRERIKYGLSNNREPRIAGFENSVFADDK